MEMKVKDILLSIWPGAVDYLEIPHSESSVVKVYNILQRGYEIQQFGCRDREYVHVVALGNYQRVVRIHGMNVQEGVGSGSFVNLP